MSLTVSPAVAASVAAAQIVSQVNNVFAQVNKFVAEGIPQRGNQPAIAADSLTAALGTDVLAKIAAATAALG